MPPDLPGSQPGFDIHSTRSGVVIGALRARVREEGRRLALVMPQTDGIVARTAELSGLRALVPTFASLDEAL